MDNRTIKGDMRKDKRGEEGRNGRVGKKGEGKGGKSRPHGYL